MDNIIITKLEKLGLSTKEGEVYLQLVKNPYSNGSQVAKKLGYPRTSVYTVLSKLQERGCILSVPEGEVTSYVAVNPKDLIFRLKKEMEEASEILKKEFEKIDVESNEKQFFNINSYKGTADRIHQMLKMAEKEIYINTNMDIEELEEFKEDFKRLKRKGVRTVFFSFHDNGYEDLGGEYYYRETLPTNESKKTKRIMMVVDMKMAIMASNYDSQFYGTFSENQLLVNIIAEHIHNDIYLKRIEEKHGIDIKSIHLGTMQEIKY